MFDPTTLDGRRDLNRLGRRKVWIGLGMVGFLYFGAVYLVGSNVVTDAAAQNAIAAVGVYLGRFGGIVVMGWGMADLAESKGHSRFQGWWALLFLVGLLVVSMLHDRWKGFDPEPRSYPVPPSEA